jgi:hypothetical protein
MAASSMLMDTASVASEAINDNSRREKFRASRTCMCSMGSACPRLSAAFAIAKDPRGDFVVVPSAEIELRAVFHRYLRPKDRESRDQTAMSQNGSPDEHNEREHNDRYTNDTYASGGTGSNRPRNNDYSRSDSGSDTDSCSHSSSDTRSYSDDEDYSTRSDTSRSQSDHSYRSRASYNSRESYSSGSCDSEQNHRSSYSNDGVPTRVDERQDHDRTENRDSQRMESGSIPETDTTTDSKNLDHAINGEEVSRNDLSEISHDGPLEDYVAAHHFHPRIIDNFFDICLERRPEDDLIPLFITTMTASERRSCSIPSQDDEYDQVVNPRTGQRVDNQFWIVPSYSLERAHEDWRDLMRSRLRNQDINETAMMRKSVSTQTASHGSNPSSVFKWEMACALARQLIQPEPQARAECQEEVEPLESSCSKEETSVSELSDTSPAEELKVAPQETPMLSYLLSSSLTPKIISAPATNSYARLHVAEINHACANSKIPSAIGSTNSEPDYSGDDESDSHRSSETKSDYTPTPSTHANQKGGENVKVEIFRAVVSACECVPNEAIGNSKKSSMALIVHYTMAFAIIVSVVTIARRLTSQEDWFVCSAQPCIVIQNSSTVQTVAQSIGQLFVGAADLSSVKEMTALITWARLPNTCDLPADAQILKFIIGSKCLAFYNYAIGEVATAHYHVFAILIAATSWVRSGLYFMYTTTPKDQVDAVEAWLRDALRRIQVIFDSLME